MGLFSKSAPTPVDESRPRATALVITADAPPQGAPRSGPYSQGTIRVVVDTPTAPRKQLSASFQFADDRWVAAGMDVPVFLDPLNPDAFDVDWASVPTMQQQVAANNPAIADPFAASRKIAAAVGITPSEKTASQYERFQKAVADAAAKPAPAGSLRGVAMLASVRGRFESTGDGDGSDGGGATRTAVSLTSNSPAVLSVALPGEAPYAVYLPKFKVPTRHMLIPGEPMDVLVKEADRQDVEIQWSELAGLAEQVAAKASDSMQANSKLIASMSEQMQAATAQAVAAPPGAPMAGTGMPPAMRAMLVDNLKRSLLYMNDPVKRQQVIDQYKTMGLDISPEELA